MLYLLYTFTVQFSTTFFYQYVFFAKSLKWQEKTFTYCLVPLFLIFKGVGVIRVDFGPMSETVYIDIILSTIIER